MFCFFSTEGRVTNIIYLNSFFFVCLTVPSVLLKIDQLIGGSFVGVCEMPKDKENDSDFFEIFLFLASPSSAFRRYDRLTVKF
jgi:hypothetical protein